mmetsp:Transcript_4243/g.10743  ORF Transcript_4243/g.10743 Transcript_4243/m.10743 type:complete len:120 (-) Transcript_4243:23-382(-)
MYDHSKKNADGSGNRDRSNVSVEATLPTSAETLFIAIILEAEGDPAYAGQLPTLRKEMDEVVDIISRNVLVVQLWIPLRYVANTPPATTSLFHRVSVQREKGMLQTSAGPMSGAWADIA